MNKNESRQYNLLINLINQGKNNKKDIFNNATNIKVAFKDGYDAIVECGKCEKYVQITTMSNLISMNRGGIEHFKHKNMPLRIFKTDNEIEDNINYASGKGIERTITKYDEKTFFGYDKIPNIPKTETDYDEKYDFMTIGLINATHRAINKKLNKYNIIDKKDKSVLVIIDESENVFFEKRCVNFRGLSSEIIDKWKKWTIQNFFDSILQIAINESNFATNTFFDEIQVYFKRNYSDTAHDEFCCSNNYSVLSDELIQENIALCQVVPGSYNNVNRMLADDKYNK